MHNPKTAIINVATYPQKEDVTNKDVRYCCSYLKEDACEKCMIFTGVRWNESNARKERGARNNHT